jgi:hypothetical protein
MTTELTVIEAKEQNDTLSKLASEIRDLFVSAEHKAKRAFETAGDAVNDALLCGKKLNEVKAKLKHGEWLPWLHENCPEISEDKSERYRALANSAHDRNLNDCATLRQAYIACGILPDPPARAANGDPVPVWLRCTSRLNELVEKLEQQEREQLRQWCLDTLKKL